MTLIHIVGPSGSGKDTTFKCIHRLLRDQNLEAVNIKFSRAFKGVLENIYDLPPFSLDTVEYKSKTVPGMDITFWDLLILAWSDSQNTIFGKLWLSVSIQNTLKALGENKVVVFTDIRQPYEIEAILGLPGYPQDYYQIHLRGRGTYKKSDEYIEEGAKRLLFNPVLRLNTLELLSKTCRELEEYLCNNIFTGIDKLNQVP